jgi:tRNA-uridine aminocarboxypropyltransferase
MKPLPARPDGVVAASAMRGFRRERCRGCGLPLAVCLCSAFAPLSSQLELVIVMPASESRSMSNTARVLARWLPAARLIVRGLPPGEMQGSAALGDAIQPEHAVLLFPIDAEPAATAGSDATPMRVPSSGGLERPLPARPIRQLVVADGTWSQARRIARRELDPLGLPRLALDRAWPSIYELRRKPSGLCTFEAVAIALGLLDSAELAARLLERFSLWSDYQLQVKRGNSPTPASAAAAPHPALARLYEITNSVRTADG